MHLNLSAFVGRTKTDVLGNLMEIALRVQARYPGQAHFVLVLRADGEPQLEDAQARVPGESGRARHPRLRRAGQRRARAPRAGMRTSASCIQEA